MPNYSSYPAKIRAIVEPLSRDLLALISQVADKTLTVAEWQSIQERTIARYITAAFMAGRGKFVLSDDEIAAVRRWTAAQMQYTNKFASDLENWPDDEDFPQKYRNRATQYATSVVVPFYSGETWGIPLPAMPGDGTSICGQADKCSWSIAKLDGEGNWNATWKLHPAEHCQTCIERARLWNPLRIRNYQLLIPDQMLAKEFAGITRKHLQGKHNQKRHGYRYGSATAETETIGAFHGTDKNFDEFKEEFIGQRDEGFLGRGFYFSTDPNIGRSNKITMEVVIQTKNPLRLEKTSWNPNEKKELVRKSLGLPSSATPQDVTREATKRGYDSVILDYKNLGYNQKEIVVFSSGQINITNRMFNK